MTKTQIPQTWMLLKSILCTEMGLGLLSISTLNPSLSMILSAWCVPVFSFCGYTERVYKRVLMNIGVLMCFPAVILGGFVGLFGGDFGEVVVLAQNNWVVFGGWLFPFVCCFYWPVVMGLCVVVNL